MQTRGKARIPFHTGLRTRHHLSTRSHSNPSGTRSHGKSRSIYRLTAELPQSPRAFKRTVQCSVSLHAYHYHARVKSTLHCITLRVKQHKNCLNIAIFMYIYFIFYYIFSIFIHYFNAAIIFPTIFCKFNTSSVRQERLLLTRQ